jgi:1,6-anhydro-N-acetylmuramate kinase
VFAARVKEDANDQHEWPCSSRSGVGLMAGTERDAVSQALAGTDRPTRRIQSEGSVGEVRRSQRLLPIGAAGQYLGVSRATVERLVYRGELPTVKVSYP